VLMEILCLNGILRMVQYPSFALVFCLGFFDNFLSAESTVLVRYPELGFHFLRTFFCFSFGSPWHFLLLAATDHGQQCRNHQAEKSGVNILRFKVFSVSNAAVNPRPSLIIGTNFA
jgi:hypothetical protein